MSIDYKFKKVAVKFGADVPVDKPEERLYILGVQMGGLGKIIKENSKYILAQYGGSRQWVDRIRGTIYCNPQYIIFTKLNEDTLDRWGDEYTFKYTLQTRREKMVEALKRFEELSIGIKEV